MGFPGGSDGKESACNAGDLGPTPALGRSPGEGNSYPLHYSGLENAMDRRAWWATVHGVAKGQTQLSACACTDTNISYLSLDYIAHAKIEYSEIKSFPIFPKFM